MKVNLLSMLFLLFLPALGLSQSPTVWPNGKNVCTGKWRYTQLGKCNYGQDKSKPITKIVGYHKKVQPCVYKGGPQEKVGVQDKKVRHFSTTNFHHTIHTAFVCDSHKPNDPTPGLDFYRRVDFDHNNLYLGRKCNKRNKFTKKCEGWDYEFETTCRFERWQVKADPNRQQCPLVDDHSRPITAVTGYKPLNGYHNSCPGKKSLETTYGFDASTLMKAPQYDQKSFACSTKDSLVVKTAKDVKTKFDAIMETAVDLSFENGQCEAKEKLVYYLQSVVDEHGESLSLDDLETAFTMLEILSECES